MPQSSNCVNCEAPLTGNQRKFCSNKCKQVLKYAVKTGRACGACFKPTKPVPVLGGFKSTCERKRCIKKREQA